VLQHPDRDQPRLVLADYLQERRDPRGELIQLQVERARATSPDAAAEARIAELLAQHRKRWLEPIRFKHGQFRFARGFVYEVPLPPRAWRHLVRVFEHEPVERVVLRCDRGDRVDTREANVRAALLGGELEQIRDLEVRWYFGGYSDWRGPAPSCRRWCSAACRASRPWPCRPAG